MSTRTDTLFPYTTLFRSLRDFDPVSFVNDSVAAARNRGEQTLQESNSALGSAIGGTAADNTMAAFLAQRGSNDLAATLAGVRASATQTAAEIARGNVDTAAGVNQNTAGTVAEIGNLTTGEPTTTRRSEEGRVGKGCGNTGRFRGWPEH